MILKRFALCKLFEQAYKEHTVYRYHTQTWYDGGGRQAIWYHDAGKGCFNTRFSESD